MTLVTQKDYAEFIARKKREREEKKDDAQIEPIKKAATQIDKVSKILEAFVVKVNFNLKKLIYAVVDERAKVGVVQ